MLADKESREPPSDASEKTVETQVTPFHRIHFDLFTLFPAMFVSPLGESIVARALERALISICLHNIRDFTTDRHHICDDTPYGGGGGMVMKPEPIVRALETVLSRPPGWSLSVQAPSAPLPDWNPDTPATLPATLPVILLSPQGRPLTQRIVAELAQQRRIALICGRYEGVDERVRLQLATHEISLGDYVISGGELAAMILVDAITRLQPGALGDDSGAHQDSHSPGLDGLLEGPQYTRPFTFRGHSVPAILVSGHHANVVRWRRQQALLRTLEQRPDLLSQARLSSTDLAFLRQHGWPTAESGT